MRPFLNQADVPAGHDNVQETDGEVVGDAGGIPMTAGTQDANTFEIRAFMVGLKAEDFNRVVTLRGRQYQIVEILPNRPKFPVLVKRLPDGKRFKVSVEQLKERAY